MMNQIRKIASGLFFVLFLTVFFSCKNDADVKKQLLTRKWNYKEFSMNGEVMSGEQLGNPWMEFKDDGTYQAQFGPRLEEGEWRIDKDELLTKSKNDNKENRLKIKELTENSAVFYNETDNTKATVSLVPASE